MCRYATYSGSSPYQAPAAVGCIPYLEHARGAWYVEGGLARLRDALARLLADLGVVVHTGATVSQVLTADGRPPRGLAGSGRAAGGRAGRRCWWPGSGCPPTSWSAARIRPGCTGTSARPARCAAGSAGSARRRPGSWCWPGVRGRTAGLAHHNVIFSADYRAEFADIFGRRQPPADPTIYVGCPAAQDPSTAPPGHESLTLLVNVPAGSPGSWGRSAADYQELLLDKLAAAGVGVRGRVLFTETLTPADFERRYDGWMGSIYGLVAQRPARPVPAARQPGPAGRAVPGRRVGPPGGGLPLVVIGSRIVADLVTEDLATGRI